MNPKSKSQTVEIEIDDGVAELRPVLSSDAPLLEEAWMGLSADTRYARFGFGIDHLTNQELKYLTDVDQRRHVAIGALIDGEAAGIGRYVQVEGSDCAEVALTVVDRFQQRGLGRELFKALVAVARHDGVDAFCFEVAPSNEAVKSLIERLIPVEPESMPSGGRVQVASLPAGEHEQRIVDLMEWYRATG